MTAYEYKRDLSHNYLILTGEQKGQEDYRTRMMERNTVHGILPCSIRYVDNQIKYYYDISSRQPLASAFSIRKMDFTVLCKIFTQLEAAMGELKNYLLDSSRILLDVRYIYWDMKEEKIYLIYYPQQEDEEGRIRRFSEELLNMVDYSDKRAVDAVYLFYQKAAAENFMLSEMFDYFREQATGKPERCMEDEKESSEGNNTGKEINGDVEHLYEVETEAEEEYEGGIQKKILKRLHGKKYFLGMAFVIITMMLAAGYIITFYELTKQEILVLGGTLAAVPTACVVYMIRRRQSLRTVKEEEISQSRLEEEGSYRKQLSKMQALSPEQRRVEDREHQPEKGMQYRQPDASRNGEEIDTAYGETTYFGADNWQQERCLEGRMRGKQIVISIDKTPFIIGKLPDAVSFVLCDITVSRIHAQFIEREGKLFLQDMNSRNGTYKNGVLLEAEELAEVYPRDEIQFGRLRFTYH